MIVAIPNRTSYAASKFAVQGYCESLRAELASGGVLVHIVSPGYIKTNLSRSAVTGDGGKYNKSDASTENGATPEYVSKVIIDSVIKGKADIIVKPGLSASAALWVRFFIPGLFQKLMVSRYEKSLQEK